VAEIRKDQSEINARIVYWGVAGAGVSTNLAMIHGKLKQSNRGALQRVPTRIDPTIEYEVLPIELGTVNGVRTRVHVIGVPAAPEQAPTRKQLLDRVDGVVFVADSRPERMADNVASLRELVDFLSDYGHTPSDLPFVVQTNKCDLVDAFAIEHLQREIRIPGATIYEASAKTGRGILETLSKISKQVVRHLGQHDTSREERAAPATDTPSSLIESAILAEADDEVEAQAVSDVANIAQAMLDRPFDALVHETKSETGARIGADFRIVSVGDAQCSGERALRVPLVLGNDDGETVTLSLTVQLDPLMDADS